MSNIAATQPILPAGVVRRAQWAIWCALALAVVAPLAVWLDPQLIELSVVPHALMQGVPHAITPGARLAGVAITAIPCGLLAWGLLGLLPALRRIGAGQLAASAGPSVARLGTAVALVGFYEPAGRAALMLALSAGTGELRVAFAVSASGVLLVGLGATLVALGHVLRAAAAALEENQGFV